ncbi:superoxide dismutase family protein [Paenibacillus sp. LHD-117]|uniref:superoxide dismutase family protein n=1 Tax=Paenibacillus sp. LHD-117 TaxID=3071412 RepID=UPI0027DF58EE|nr:superoxide dismutase family protein [Paenibacillus sp. LHD-117]MDQ6423645.1 superoxide dismutase family protein [Paenibacillus sp. LHD-117]
MTDKRFSLKQMVAVFLCGSLFFSGVAMAQPTTITAGFEKLRFMVTGEDRSSADGMYNNQGSKVPESILYKGTTYVPIRKVSEMLNMPVQWEGSTKTVWIGAVEVEVRDATGGVIGQATLSQGENGVNVHFVASGLTPGKHGFHLHEKPIEGNDFATAGGHFNPHGKQHGHHNAGGHHLGDLHNLTVQEDGTVSTDLVVEGATMEKGKETSVWGKSLVIHAKEDDGKTDPSGNSGDRIAGGNIVEAAE